MGLVQGREDGMETPWQEVEPALEQELLSPKIYFLFLSLFPLHTHVPFLPSLPASKDKGAGSISTSEGEEQRLVATSLIVRHRTARCGDSVHQVATNKPND